MLYLWQLPQNILGLLIIFFGGGVKTIKEINGKQYTFYFVNYLFNSGVSLGNYIILDSVYCNVTNSCLTQTILHEYGHQKQSKILGIFYLFAVGIVSFIRNIYDRIAHKKWTDMQRYIWYYKGYPERWADKLGGVKR